MRADSVYSAKLLTAIDSDLKRVQKTAKQAGHANDPVLHRKWMRFGDGFYNEVAYTPTRDSEDALRARWC